MVSPLVEGRKEGLEVFSLRQFQLSQARKWLSHVEAVILISAKTPQTAFIPPLGALGVRP